MHVVNYSKWKEPSVLLLVMGRVMQELEMTHAPQYCAMDITAMDITK